MTTHHLLSLLLATITVLSLPLNSPLLPSYDYIIIGGGPAGLALANRLSAIPTLNILLLEAGPADQNEPSVTIPAFIGTTIGGRYDWNLSTVPQTYLDGRPRNIPQGRALGGGTLLNGMLWSRGGQGDYRDWVELGNEGWGWDDLLPFFERSETFTPVWDADVGWENDIQMDAAVHGFDGPVNVSFPKFFWPSSAVLFDALNELGVPTAYDPNAGLVAGASFLPMDIDPGSQERCTARRAYFDPVVGRGNLWVQTEVTATQVLFEGRPRNGMASQVLDGDVSVGGGGHPGIPTGIFGGTTTLWFGGVDGVFGGLVKRLRRLVWKRQEGARAATSSSTLVVATGVEFAANSGAPRHTVSATREVIVAAGALHSPQLLMLSGIGPASALQRLGIPVNVYLPGVGSNLQDHGQVWAWYPFYNTSYSNPTMLTHNETYAAEAWEEYWTNHTGPLTSGAIDGVAFPSLPYITNGSLAIPAIAASQPPYLYLPPSTPPTVLAGYTAQHRLLTSALTSITRAAHEIINANDGVLTVANQRPFSRGTLTLRSPYPFDPPLIDPRYGSNPLDFEILLATLHFNQRLLSTSALATMNPEQKTPGALWGREEVLQYIQRGWQTEYHPAGTCAMMPLQLGGVVGRDLLVHGTRNLRVVDSSVIPMLPAAHLQAVVYGVAEKAADIVISAALSSDVAVVSRSSSTATDPPSVATVSQVSSATSPSSSTTDMRVMTTFFTVVYTQTVYASQ